MICSSAYDFHDNHDDQVEPSRNTINPRIFSKEISLKGYFSRFQEERKSPGGLNDNAPRKLHFSVTTLAQNHIITLEDEF